MTPATTHALTLNNGVTMPALGLGVFQSPPEETTAAVVTALRDGYRLIDTAAAYDNEREVGEGIRRSGVPRDEIFVTTKLWISDYGYDAAQVGFEASLRRLGLDHVDLYLPSRRGRRRSGNGIARSGRTRRCTAGPGVQVGRPRPARTRFHSSRPRSPSSSPVRHPPARALR